MQTKSSGGDIHIKAGDGGINGNGGDLIIKAGDGHNGMKGGDINIKAGDAQQALIPEKKEINWTMWGVIFTIIGIIVSIILVIK